MKNSEVFSCSLEPYGYLKLGLDEQKVANNFSRISKGELEFSPLPDRLFRKKKSENSLKIEASSSIKEKSIRRLKNGRT